MAIDAGGGCGPGGCTADSAASASRAAEAARAEAEKAAAQQAEAEEAAAQTAADMAEIAAVTNTPAVQAAYGVSSFTPATAPLSGMPSLMSPTPIAQQQVALQAAVPTVAAFAPTPLGPPSAFQGTLSTQGLVAAAMSFASRTAPPNGTARISNQPTGHGLATGFITVNGNTYPFNSGARNLASTPLGTYRVTEHRNHRTDKAFVRDGVGFSFAIEDARRPNSNAMYDPRLGRDRTDLRIHPDGGARGTEGCIGIVGDGDTMRQFRDDMNAEINRNGGSFTLSVE